MFAWDFAKSAEAMFSRWAIKRICKFVLKKKLGDYILGDIDLDQLDVQLRQGTIMLSDLALNIDFINLKLGTMPLMVKEGSIGSLSITIPWKMENCQIEIEELELVVSPSMYTRNSDCCEDTPTASDNDNAEVEPSKEHNSSAPVSLDVHEGVKTIAKVVKLFLTSFHVRLKNLIIAFDPGTVKGEPISSLSRTLVLRIAETEYGTHIAEERNSLPNLSLLGIGKLINFVKFQGVVLEFLEMNDSLQRSTTLRTNSNEYDKESLLTSGVTTKILGGVDGVSGILSLSIPWKNGCLDIRRVDADIAINPVEVTLQPSTILWLAFIWRSLQEAAKDDNNHRYSKTRDSLYPTGRGCEQQVAPGSSSLANEMSRSCSENSNSDLYSAYSQDKMPRAMLPGSHVIHNWIPLSFNKDGNYAMDPDYGASIDQFFECFDGIRSSQSYPGNSGIWNWTCSVFSAITAASNLASGCGNVPSEQQNVETTLKASIASFSVVLSFEDDPNYSCQLIGGYQQINDMLGTQYRSFSSVDVADGLKSSINFGTYIDNLPFLDAECATEEPAKQSMHFLSIICLDLEINMQIYPQCTKFDAKVRQIKVEDHFREDGFLDCNANFASGHHMVHHIQESVRSALPPFPFSSLTSDENHHTCNTGDCHLDMQSECGGRPISCDEQLIKVTLFETFGECCVEYNVRSISSNDKSVTPSSFSINLPPFIFWVDFYLLSSLMNLFKQVGDSFLTREPEKVFESSVVEGQLDLLNVEVRRTADRTPSKITSSNRNLQGNIALPNAKIILCFNSDHRGLYQVFDWEKFISLEISPPILDKVSKQQSVLHSDSKSSHSYTESTSICLDCGVLDVYLVTTIATEASITASGLFKKHFCTSKIFSAVVEPAAHDSMVTMFWQKGSVTGPWMARRAWNLATQHDPRSRNKTTGRGQEFASVTTAEDLMEANCHLRPEMILSSCFFLHIHLSLICARLTHNEYELLNLLIDQACNTLKMEHDIHTANKRKSDQVDTGSQVSILVESDVLDVQVTLGELLEISRPMQKELAGSWTSFRLKVNKFDLLSVSDIGGVVGASFFGLNHGEGDLWGSISDIANKSSAGNLEFLLITCRDSTLRRGDGEGGNAISSGSAGTSVMNSKNPVIHESFTSVTVKCGTIIAPGCRLDWFGSLYSFFSLHSHESVANDEYAKSADADTRDSRSHFSLDLVDVALSYEPHIRISDFGRNTAVCHEPSSLKYSSCLLAAASLNFSNHDTGSGTTDDYNICLQDVGFLICELDGPRDGQYDVEYLRRTGYVKVAGDPLILSVVRTNCDNGLLWEVEFSDSHVKMMTCRDTTMGLFRLLSQLQQLFAIDMEEFLVHLQSRWTATKQAQDMHMPDSNVCVSLESDNSSGGLMDEVVDDVFLLPVEQVLQSNSCEIQLDNSYNRERKNLGFQDPNFDNISSRSFSSSSLELCGGAENPQSDSTVVKPLTDIIESYCVSELSPQRNQHCGKQSSEGSLGNEAHSISPTIDETEKGGWYRSGSPLIVENHISGLGECHDNQLNDEYSPLLLRSSSREKCKPKGRVILKNTDIKWMMYGGSDWLGSGHNSAGINSAGRDENTCLELQLLGMDIQLDMYPDGEIPVSKLALSIQEFHLYDISVEAPWKTVLGYYHSKRHPRETCSKAFKMDLDSVRPDPTTPLEEYRLHLALLPMRLHLDQSQLDFLINFFGGNSLDSEVCDQSNDLNDGQGDKINNKQDSGQESVMEEALLPYFQKFEIQPIVVRVDYIPRRINLVALRGGNYIELINLVPWKGIDLQLKPVSCVGIYGWGGICETVVGEWLDDISQNQVRKVLKGIKPIRSLFSVSSGAAKLVSLPIKGYTKDRRLIKGIQRGAITFLRTISLEAVGLGVHLAAGAHDILLQTECVLTSAANRTGSSIHCNQPKDMRQGIQQAYESLSDGLGRTASALIGNPIKTYQRGSGPGAALISAIRAAPAAAVAPASSAVRAVHCALLGVRNSLDPEHTIDSLEKYHGSSTSRSQDHI